MDRRVLRTRKAIIEAFISLLGERDFEQITINDIADRANVNRGTIYLHYTDKYNLLEQCSEMYLQELCDSCLTDKGIHQITAKASLLNTFHYLEQNASIYSMLLTKKGIPAFRNQMVALMVQGIEEQIAAAGSNQGINKEITVQFFASAAVGLLEWWVVHSMPYPAEEMVEQLLSLLELHPIFTPSA